MSIMPGAVWRPITVPGGAPKRTSKGRAVVLHVAASEATSLWGFFSGNASANSHFYVAKDGTIEQYVDTDYQSWASMAANPSTISVETQGGVTNADGEPWTAAQVASLGRICAWAHATEGTPLVPMPNSLPASKGIGYHRLGIDPWRVSGGEVWSSSRGKLCPGAAKVAQIPAVIAAAQGAADMPLTPDDLNAVALAVWGFKTSGQGTQAQDRLTGMDSTQLPNIAKALAKIPTTAPGSVNVDAAALAAALLADDAAVAKLGDAIAAGLAKRVGNG